MRRDHDHRASRLLWIVAPPLLLTLLPAVLVREQAPQIRYEELAEAVRGPFWLAHRAVFDGASTNLGWYGFLLATYETFGFGLETARWARVALFGASALALSALLHRWMAPVPATAALTAFCLSPTLLFLNRITTSYGTDLLMLPFCLLLLDLLWGRSRDATTSKATLALAAGFGAVAMIAAMTYPAVLPALPFLGGWLWLAAPRGRRTAHAAVALATFLLPLAASALALRDPGSLFWDPIERAGIFRGGGVGWVDAPTFAANLGVVARDLFASGSSYYFELRAVEFGGWLGRLAFAAVAALAMVAAWKARDTRAVLASAAGAALLGLVATCAAGGPPGVRRSTIVLAAFYVAAAVTWRAAPRLASRPFARAAIAGALLLLPLHHALAFRHHLEQARRPVWGRERVWFAVADTPQDALDHWRAHVEAGGALDCRELRTPGKQLCRYDSIYAAVAGARRWNGEAPIEVRAIDPRTGEAMVLGVEGWRERALPPSSSKRRRKNVES